jgi:hypothetical protein
MRCTNIKLPNTTLKHSKGTFRINTLLKLKEEGSGYPSWVQNPKTKSDIFIPFGTVKELI